MDGELQVVGTQVWPSEPTFERGFVEFCPEGVVRVADGQVVEIDFMCDRCGLNLVRL